MLRLFHLFYLYYKRIRIRCKTSELQIDKRGFGPKKKVNFIGDWSFNKNICVLCSIRYAHILFSIHVKERDPFKLCAWL